MGKFFKYMSEETNQPSADFNGQMVDLNDEETLTKINSLISDQTEESFLTPYLALGRVKTILAQYSIQIPKMFLEGESGRESVELVQFDSEQDPSTIQYYFYIEYILNDSGYYDVFCSIVDELELAELMDDDDEEFSEPFEEQ